MPRREKLVSNARFALKFTIKQMLVAMIAFAVVASILGAGARGSATAFGLTIGLAFGGIILLTHAVLYWLGYLFASRKTRRSRKNTAIEKPTEVSP